MRYFWKALISNTLSAGGKTIQFDPVGGGRGVIATDDPEIIAVLEPRATARVGGVRELTEAEYAEEVKKKSGTSLPRKSPERQAIQGPALGSSLLQPAESAAAAASDPDAPAPEPVKKQEPLAPDQLPVAGPTVQRIGRR